MFRKTLAIIMVAVAAGLTGVLGLGPVAAQQEPSATRSFSSTTVAPGEQVVVTIVAENYGEGILAFGAVTETLPAGFDYVTSTHDGDFVEVNGQEVTFTLLATREFTYTVTAPSTVTATTVYRFTGTLTDTIGDEPMKHDVGGVSEVTVEVPAAPPPAQRPSATRSFSPTTVAPGGRVVVNITAANYGGFGRVTETLPEGFDYVSVSGDLDDDDVAVTGQMVRFTLLGGDETFSYTVTAPDTVTATMAHSFTGMLRDDEKMDYDVGGADEVTVEVPAQQVPSATRSFSPSRVAPGGQVVVTITAANYGEFGRVTETLPEGFEYVSISGDLDDDNVSVNGQMVRFTLLGGDARFTYTVTASDTAGSHTFSGVLRDEDKEEYDVGGAPRVTVRAPVTPPARPPTPTNAVPGFTSASADSVAENTTTVMTVRATDRDSRDNVTGYDITGGADRGKFSLVRNTGVLTFMTAPDYEVPTDADTDNDYVVMVRATSGTGSRERTATRTITVTVTNEEEAGMVTLSEMQPVVGRAITATLSDDDEPVADTVMWQWKSSNAMGGTFNDITDATMDSYTPVDGDVDMYLMATVMYDDGHGTGKEAMMVTANAVIAASDDACLEPLGMLPRTVSGTWASDCESEGQANNYARYYTFTLAGETRVAIYLTSDRDTYLYLRQGEGRTGTVEHDNNNVGRGSINSRIEETLAAGTYTVEATTYYRNAVTGTFTLDVRPVVRVQELGPLTETYTTPGTWSDDFVSARQAPNYARYYEFTLETPTDLRIDLTSERDTYLYLVREDGTVVDENNNVGRSINSRIVQMALAAGTYTVEATTYYRNPVTGNFVLNIGLTR